MKSFPTRALEGTWSSVTPLRFLDQYKPSVLQLFFGNKNLLWVQYLRCTGTAPVSLKKPPSCLLYLSISLLSLVCFNWHLIEQLLLQALLLDSFVFFFAVGLGSVVDAFHLSQMTCNCISKPTFSPVKSEGWKRKPQNKTERRHVCVPDCSSNKPDSLQLVNYLFAAVLD